MCDPNRVNFNNAIKSNNPNIFFGTSSRLKDDFDYYQDYVDQSVASGNYRLDVNYVDNCKKCLPRFGPRTNNASLSYGVSTVLPYSNPQFKNTVDVESILTNRNVPASRAYYGGVNPINVTKLPLHDAPICNNFLDPISTHLTNPPINYKGAAVNRFYDLTRDVQKNIFWDFSINTQLEAKDNHFERIPRTFGNQYNLPEYSLVNPQPVLTYALDSDKKIPCNYNY